MIPTQPKKIWPYVVTIVFLIFVVQSPEVAASIVSGAVRLLFTGAEAVGTFVEAL
ncbi:hypothetical protein AB0I72_23415 [Nocardiopsis sp. NPDC049922]|uniref:hypothetical protein n=1 Tax=Nocardiopsis sp. NPDC049922 TaxID=3155157 RepID=UPI0033D1164D